MAAVPQKTSPLLLRWLHPKTLPLHSRWSSWRWSPTKGRRTCPRPHSPRCSRLPAPPNQPSMTRTRRAGQRSRRRLERACRNGSRAQRVRAKPSCSSPKVGAQSAAQPPPRKPTVRETSRSAPSASTHAIASPDPHRCAPAVTRSQSPSRGTPIRNRAVTSCAVATWSAVHSLRRILHEGFMATARPLPITEVRSRSHASRCRRRKPRTASR